MTFFFIFKQTCTSNYPNSSLNSSYTSLTLLQLIPFIGESLPNSALRDCSTSSSSSISSSSSSSLSLLSSSLSLSTYLFLPFFASLPIGETFNPLFLPASVTEFFLPVGEFRECALQNRPVRYHHYHRLLFASPPSFLCIFNNHIQDLNNNGAHMSVNNMKNPVTAIVALNSSFISLNFLPIRLPMIIHPTIPHTKSANFSTTKKANRVLLKK